MATAIAAVRLTEEEYLQRERAAVERSEFVQGEVIAMAGGSPRHSRLTVRAIRLLDSALDNMDCGVFAYPDASVVCGPPQFDDQRPDVLLNPMVVVEVLSPSTAGYDRGLKFSLYREIGSVREYVLIHPEAAWIEHFSRTEAGQWLLTDIRGLDAVLSLPALAIEIPLSSLYRGVFELPM